MTTATVTDAPETTRVQLATGAIKVSSGGQGDPIVILHHDNGAPHWQPFFDNLARDHRVIVPDLPGFGDSERPEWARHPRDLGLLVHALLDDLGIERCTLVGLGFGGWIAAEMAAANTQRVKSLVLVNAMGIKPPQGEILDQMLIDFPEYTRAGFATDERFAQEYGEAPPKEVITVWDFAREMVARIAWKPYMFSLQLPHVLLNLKVPTLVAWGDNNRIVPRSAGEEYARLIPKARFEVVANAGHFADIEQPDALADLVRKHAARA